MSASSVAKKINVIGAGLGGLAFAQGARLFAGYEVTVFERDASPTYRSQGYQIGLNEDGVSALQKLNLKGFQELTKENPLSGFMMTDHKLNPLVRFTVQDIDNIKDSKMSLVNRFKLRDILAVGLNIQWNKKFLSFEEGDESVIAHFEDGTTGEAALLVGADGVNSRVRTQYRPDIQYEKTGITSVGGFFPMSADVNNELPKMKAFIQQNLGRSLLPDSNTMLFMRFIASNGQENLLWSLSFDTELCRVKQGELPAAAEEGGAVLLQELRKRVEAAGSDPGKQTLA